MRTDKKVMLPCSLLFKEKELAMGKGNHVRSRVFYTEVDMTSSPSFSSG
jgi:hypothetical protein